MSETGAALRCEQKDENAHDEVGTPLSLPLDRLVGHGTEAVQVSASHEHLVQFYEDEAFLFATVADFLGQGIQAGEGVIVIATEPHRQAFARQLEAKGFDVARLCNTERLTFLDAHEVLAKFMRDGEPDRKLFEAEVGSVFASVAAALTGDVRLRAYGEMVDVLWQKGQRNAAICLEELWNDLQHRYSFALLCAYAMASFYKEPAALHRVCSTHTHVIDGHAPTAQFEGRAATALPPQHARLLAQEIAHRERIEQALRDSLRELRHKEEALRINEAQLRDFVDNATIGLHRVGPDGTILWANRAELDLLGYAELEYLGRPISEFHADQNVIDDILARLGRGEVLHNYEARLRAKDGSIKHVLISSNVCSHDGKFAYTRCFTRDITARRQAEEALQHKQRQLELVTDALPVLVSYVDDNQRYRFVSAAYERWFGRNKAEFLGKPLNDVLGDQAYAAVKSYVAQALSGTAVEFEAEVPYRDAGTRCIEASYIPQFAEGGRVNGFVSLVADTTERKNFERFRAAAAERTERLLMITGAIADAVTSEQVFEALVDHVASVIQARSVALWLVDDDTRTAKLIRSVGFSAAAQRQFDCVDLDAAFPAPFSDSIRKKQPIWIASQIELLERYPHLRSSATPNQAYRIWCLPIMAQDRVLGTLAVTIDERHEVREDEQDFLLLVARYASQAVERLRLFEAEHKSRAVADAAALRLGVLSQASRAFVEMSLDLDARLQGVVTGIGTTLNSAVGVTLLATDGYLQTSAVYHPDPEAQELLSTIIKSSPMRFGEGIIGTVLTTGESVLLSRIEPHELSARAAPSFRTFSERFPCHAMICSPLRVSGQIIGALTAVRTTQGDVYTTEDLRLVEELAERAAAAIDNSRLYQETVDAAFRAEQLYRFAHAVVVAKRVEDIYEAALATIEAALRTTRCAILTFDNDKAMHFRAWRNLSEAYRTAVDGHSPWPPDATAPEPVWVSNPHLDPAMAPYLPLFQSEGIGALAFIPLVSSGKLLGKFMVYYDHAHPFASYEVETARAIANHLASTIARFAAVAKLEETIRCNELFAGVLAHDLRNPLSAMMTAAQLVLMRREDQGLAGDRDTKPLSRIMSSGHRMTRMIDQLLDFTRARSGGGIDVRPFATDLAELCNQAVGELALSHPEWKIRREISGDLAGHWDPDRLLQVISNLVANAGQHGTAETGIFVKLDGTAGECVKFEVRNQGAIPASLLPHLFSPFCNTQHRRDQSRGLGLGLFVVREIIVAHGGSVDVLSSATDGTTFTIVLPRSLPSATSGDAPLEAVPAPVECSATDPVNATVSQPQLPARRLATEQLIGAAQQLSVARGLPAIATIVGRVARELTGSDGATFILREGETSFYAAEDAISPLWQGQRFPMASCISGWTMLNKEAVIIEDISVDTRIPQEAYRPTFVKSLAMVPITGTSTLGAIGTYWAKPHRATTEEVKLLAALADLTAVAMENVELYADLESRIGEAEKAISARDEFITVAAHELRTPLTALLLQLQRLEDLSGRQTTDNRTRLVESASRAVAGAQRLAALIDGLLDASQLLQDRIDLNVEEFDLAQITREVVGRFAAPAKRAGCELEVVTPQGVTGKWDRLRLEQVLTNLLSNALKFGAGRPIRVSIERREVGVHLEIRDHGVGIAPDVADRIFERFGRAGPISHYGGFGLGLYVAREVVAAHGGTIRFESAPARGCTFIVDLPFRPLAEGTSPLTLDS